MQELNDQLKRLLNEAMRTKELSEASRANAMSGLDNIEDEETKARLKGYNAKLSELEQAGDSKGVHDLIAELTQSMYDIK